LWTALLIQFATVWLLRVGLGKGWLRRPVTLLILASVVCDGVSQVLLAFPSVGVWDDYRTGVAQGYNDDAALLMSAAMLAFTVAYLLIGPQRAGNAGACVPLRMLDWRLLALACAPLAVLTYEGRGRNTLLQTGNGAPLATSIASEFFVILVVLAAFSFILRYGSRWFLPVLLVQSVLLAAAGERTPVLTDAIALIVLLCWAGMRPQGRELGAAAGLTMVAILAITGLRAAQGRSVFYVNSGLGTRVAALGGGLTALDGAPASGVPPTAPLVAQAALRLDGDAFAGAILQARHRGYPRLSAAYVPASLLVAVPSAVWPSKLDHVAVPAVAETDDFGLQQVNFLPGLVGLYAGFLSPQWLIAALAALGALCGWGERCLLRRRTPARFVLTAGAVIAALAYQQGLPGMLVDLRTATVIAAAAWALQSVRAAQKNVMNARSSSRPRLG